MKVVLFKFFNDAYRQGMETYTRSLKSELSELMSSREKIGTFLPKPFFRKPDVLRYLSQYGYYQAAAPFAAGDVNHIMDHAYAHLVHSLDPAKTVVTFHDANWLEARGRTRPPQRFVQRWTLGGLAKAGRIVCDSESSRAALLKYLPNVMNKTIVIYPGLEDIFFQDSPAGQAAELNIGQGPWLLHTGNTEDYKNIPALFHVLNLVRKKGVPAKLLKTGAPFTEDQSRLSAKLGLSQCMTHLGHVDRSLLPQLYRKASVLILPSLNEGFGFPVLEAMASGTPVVISNGGSLPEVAGSGVPSFDPQDHAGMAGEVLALLEQTELYRKRAESGLLRARNFSWKTTAEKMLALYREVHAS